MLSRGLFLHEYMDKWIKFSETSLPKKEDFYGSINMEDIPDTDYKQAKRVREAFEMKTI